MKPIQLTLTQKFDIEKFNRIIDSCDNIDELKKISKELLQVWQLQKAATNWVIHENSLNPLLNVDLNVD